MSVSMDSVRLDGEEEATLFATSSSSTSKPSILSVAERQQALRDVAKDAASAWPRLPESLKVDKQVVLEALTKSPTLPASKSAFERAWPTSLRWDKQVVLAWTGRDDFCTLYRQRCLYVPSCLKQDKQVMMAYCRTIPRALQDVDVDNPLADDMDVVLSAVQRNGLELQYASRRLQQDPDMIRVACRTDGRALELTAPGSEVRAALTSDREFMLDVLQQPPGTGGCMFRLLTVNKQNPNPLATDREILLEALVNGGQHAILSYEPAAQCLCEYMTQDASFVQQAVGKNPSLYLELGTSLYNGKNSPTASAAASSSTSNVRQSTSRLHANPARSNNSNNSNTLHFQKVPKVAMAAVLSPQSNAEVHRRALQHLPDLANNHDVVLAICERGDVEHIKEILLANDDHEASIFLDHIDIMTVALKRCSSLFAHVSTRLKQHPDIMRAALDAESAANILASMNPELQAQYPEVVAEAIQVASQRSLVRIERSLDHADAWEHRQVALAWIRRGSVINDRLVARIRNDEDLALELARGDNWFEFRKVGPRWLADRAFMQKALDINGRVLQFAADELRNHDLDLAMRAMANHAGALVPYCVRVDTEALKAFVRAQLDLHTTFHEILCAISVTKPHLPPARRSPLRMLDRGVETSQALKQLIAEFSGVPIGEHLGRLRRAWTNLTDPPPASQQQESVEFAWRDRRAGLRAGPRRQGRMIRQRLAAQGDGDGAAAAAFWPDEEDLAALDERRFMVRIHFGPRPAVPAAAGAAAGDAGGAAGNQAGNPGNAAGAGAAPRGAQRARNLADMDDEDDHILEMLHDEDPLWGGPWM